MNKRQVSERPIIHLLLSTFVLLSFFPHLLSFLSLWTRRSSIASYYKEQYSSYYQIRLTSLYNERLTSTFIQQACSFLVQEGTS